MFLFVCFVCLFVVFVCLFVCLFVLLLVSRMTIEFTAIGKFSERNTPASKLRTGIKSFAILAQPPPPA